MGWNDYSKTAEKGTGGDWPEIPDDLYTAVIMDVSDPETKADPFNVGRERTDFYITWEILDGDAPLATLRDYINIPEGYINDGYLNEKAKLYKRMEALGFDLAGKFRVDPPAWCGMEARVMVENKPNKDGDLRPRITDVKPPRTRARAQKTQPAKQPVGAGAGSGLRRRMNDDDSIDNLDNDDE